MYPDVPSRVVHARHAGVWDGEDLVAEAIRQMLDASITELTGLDDAGKAWAALFDPDERIAIKVNAFRNSIIWTHVPLVMAVTECLQEAGVPAEQIVIFDYYTRELDTAGYPVNEDGPGVRCYGTDSNYTAGWQLAGRDIRLSDVVLDCDEYAELGGPGYEGRVRSMLRSLGFTDTDLYLLGEALSGGQKKLVGLAKLLVTQPDLLLLDEPDNHLDLEGKAFLERFIRSYEGAVIIVSHDHYLLDLVVDEIVELEDGRLTRYPGNYSEYAFESCCDSSSSTRRSRKRLLDWSRRLNG